MAKRLYQISLKFIQPFSCYLKRTEDVITSSDAITSNDVVIMSFDLAEVMDNDGSHFNLRILSICYVDITDYSMKASTGMS
jgi:hypothetical protein